MNTSYTSGQKKGQSQQLKFCRRSVSFPRKLDKLTDKDKNTNFMSISHGRPVLPPIPQFDFSYDPWMKSKLMKTGSTIMNQETLKKYS